MTDYGYGIISNGGIVDLDTIRELPFNAEVVGVLVEWCDLMNNKVRQIDKLEAENTALRATIANTLGFPKGGK